MTTLDVDVYWLSEKPAGTTYRHGGQGATVAVYKDSPQWHRNAMSADDRPTLGVFCSVSDRVVSLDDGRLTSRAIPCRRAVSSLAVISIFDVAVAVRASAVQCGGGVSSDNLVGARHCVENG